MTSVEPPDLESSGRLNRGLRRIASASGIDAILRATTEAAQELANATGLCAVPNDQTHCLIATADGVATLSGNTALQRLIASAADGGEAIVQHRPHLEVELPSRRRLLAETLLTVPIGEESGFVGLAFFWRDGANPSTEQLASLPALAWTSCLALRTQQHAGELRECRAEHRAHISELQHRARNVLAVVRSIIRRSGNTAESQEDFASHLEARISALARTQGALTFHEQEGPELEDLVRAELAANAVREDQVVIAGPSLRLAPRAAEAMALTLHELTTNALKFGALMTPEGRLTVSWSIESIAAPTMRWRWIESNVQVAQTSPERRGFGRELIERVLPYELGAVTSFTITSDGARCEIELPINERTTARMQRA
ncbi:sensor histidine kinase [Steroidobacter sp. S1-65]|uniref:histidine kinase n=1 Tax=Steroidobacter gossypii TaxID=2805490 RepID=A0ABS1X4A4_9GAMM|nr:sensor histidine kinase [Steroidobacter gossypii]MBM0108048.1 sensor histidine kinase [Steroidobacter gossypii]